MSKESKSSEARTSCGLNSSSTNLAENMAFMTSCSTAAAGNAGQMNKLN